MFYEYSGDLIGLETTDNHLIYRWSDRGCKILFSVCRHGNAASCHFSSDKNGLRKLRVAINEFMGFVFKSFTWCEMIIAIVKVNSVKRLVEKFGFSLCAHVNDHDIYYLPKENYNGFVNI